MWFRHQDDLDHLLLRALFSGLGWGATTFKNLFLRSSNPLFMRVQLQTTQSFCCSLFHTFFFLLCENICEAYNLYFLTRHHPASYFQYGSSDLHNFILFSMLRASWWWYKAFKKLTLVLTSEVNIPEFFSTICQDMCIRAKLLTAWRPFLWATADL